MSKKFYRYFGSLLQAQEKWLNQMAEKGYRLISVDKMCYEFEVCRPGQVQYCVEFIGQKSAENAQDYHNFLEDIGYKVFYKNINLNYSIGKIRYRPWAEKGGSIATNRTTFNKELLIVEKENDGKPFELHTSFEDKIKYYRNVRNPWLYFLGLFIILGLFSKSYLWGICGLLTLVPILIYQFQIVKLKGESKTKEW